jgi:AbrB family looped-hinge helix DNA binding protein
MATLQNKKPVTPPKPKGSYDIKIQSGGRITIPADVRKYYGFEPGKKVRMIVRRDTIYIKK